MRSPCTTSPAANLPATRRERSAEAAGWLRERGGLVDDDVATGDLAFDHPHDRSPRIADDDANRIRRGAPPHKTAVVGGRGVERVPGAPVERPRAAEGRAVAVDRHGGDG